MSMTSIRTASSEYTPYHAVYVEAVPDGDILTILRANGKELDALIASVPEERGGYRYAEGKWSVREVVGHVADTERIFAYRALRFARADQTPLAGFDENAYVPAANADARDLDSLVDEWVHVRLATLALLRGLDAGAPLRRGKANDQEISVRALAWVMAGHVDHHAAILRERYLGES